MRRVNFFYLSLLGILLIPNFHLLASANEEKVLQIIEEQPDAVEDWIEDRIYLSPSRITITHQGAFLCQKGSAISLPPFAVDQKGIFIRCKEKEVSQEAQEHYDKAKEAFVDALGWSTGTGVAIAEGLAPLAIYEGYKAVEAWKEAAKEYNAGRSCERNDTTDGTGSGTSPSGPDRDR